VHWVSDSSGFVSLPWFVGWFEVGCGGGGWILVDPVVVGGGLRDCSF
jgi:hypothetical protein